MQTILSIIILALTKIADNIIITAKSITTYQNKKLLSSILVVISQFMFYFIIKQIITDSTVLSIVIVSISSGIGTYIAFLINDKFKKDIMWLNILTCSDREDITKLSNYLVKYKIKYVVNDSYTRRWDKTYSIMVFAKSKNESKMIDSFLQSTEVKYFREILR